jgi:hypothetical protein
MKILKLYLVVILAINMFLYDKANATQSIKGPADVLSEYLLLQFSGEEDLLSYVCFSSKEAKNKILDYHVKDGMLYDFRYDSYFLVKQYKISNYEPINKQSIYEVSYENIGYMKSFTESGKLKNKFIEAKGMDTIKYRMAKKNNKWCVLDPPQVRVNTIKILNKYQDLQLRFESVYAGNEKELKNERDKPKSLLRDTDEKIQSLKRIIK